MSSWHLWNQHGLYSVKEKVNALPCWNSSNNDYCSSKADREASCTTQVRKDQPFDRQQVKTEKSV